METHWTSKTNLNKIVVNWETERVRRKIYTNRATRTRWQKWQGNEIRRLECFYFVFSWKTESQFNHSSALLLIEMSYNQIMIIWKWQIAMTEFSKHIDNSDYSDSAMGNKRWAPSIARTVKRFLHQTLTKFRVYASLSLNHTH